MVIGGYAPSLLNFRGPLLQALVERGHEVLACAPDMSEPVREGLDRMGVRHLEIPLVRAGLSPLQDWQTLKFLRNLFNQEDPDHILAYTAKPVIYASLAAAGKFRVHAMITGLGYAFGNLNARQMLVGTVVRQLYRRALARVQGVFFQNPDDRELFRQLKLLPSGLKVTMINGSGVDLEFFQPRPLPAEPVFLLIARLLADKGIREYYEAARAIKQDWPNARFLLAGWMDPNPMNVQPDELERWQQSGVIEYLGNLDDVRPAYAACRVYVLPSYREGTPRTVLEAMAVGRPVITTDAPGCRETVIDGVNGVLVPVKDVASLRQAMVRFLESPGLADDMAAASIHRVRERYDVHQVNQVIIDTLEA